MLADERPFKSDEFERRLTPELTKIPDARVSFRRRSSMGAVLPQRLFCSGQVSSPRHGASAESISVPGLSVQIDDVLG